MLFPVCNEGSFQLLTTRGLRRSLICVSSTCSLIWHLSKTFHRFWWLCLPLRESSSALPHTSPAREFWCCRSPSGLAWPPRAPSAVRWAPSVDPWGPTSRRLAASLQLDSPSAAALAERFLLLSDTPAKQRMGIRTKPWWIHCHPCVNVGCLYTHTHQNSFTHTHTHTPSCIHSVPLLSLLWINPHSTELVKRTNSYTHISPPT